MSGTNEAGPDLREIVSRTRHILLDFDGPVCAVYAGTSSRAVADELRAALTDLPLPAEVLSDDDPLEVLKAAAAIGPTPAARAQEAFVRLELQAVSTANPTAGAAELMAAARETGRKVAIVSNNSSPAISAYLAAHDLTRYVAAVLGRDEPDPTRMKPDPYRVRQAIESLWADPAQCVLIGDSTSDVVAAHAAGIKAIGYANKPYKNQVLTDAGADYLIHSITVMVEEIRETSLRP